MISSHETISTITEALAALPDPEKDVYLANKIESISLVVVDYSSFSNILGALTTDTQKEFFINSIKSKLPNIPQRVYQLEDMMKTLSLNLQEIFFDAFKDHLPELLIKSGDIYSVEFRCLMGLINCPRQKNELFEVTKGTLVAKVKDFYDFKLVLQSLGNPANMKYFTIAVKDILSNFSINQNDLSHILWIAFKFCSDVIIEFKQMLSALTKDASYLIHSLSCLEKSQKEIFFDLTREKLLEIARIDLSQRQIITISELLPESKKVEFTSIIELLKSQNVKFKKTVFFDSKNITHEYNSDEDQPWENCYKLNTTPPLQQLGILKPPSIRFRGDDFVETSLTVTVDDQENKMDSSLSVSRRHS